MITRNSIRLENTDSADAKKLREALNLVGGEHSRESLPKQHGREDFTMMDVIESLALANLNEDRAQHRANA